jgi:uncharacterized ferritin-like protein (DUF455 family)
VLEGKGVDIETVVEARKEKIAHEALWEILTRHEKVVVAAGKTCYEFKPEPEQKEEILNRAIGRSGSLRAPAISVEKKMVIGFNDTLYERIFQAHH